MSRQQGTLPPPSRALHKADLLPLKMFSQLVQDITSVPKFAWRAERPTQAAKLWFGFLWQLPAPAARLYHQQGCDEGSLGLALTLASHCPSPR